MLVTPPLPPRPSAPLSPWRTVALLRTNTLELWSDEVYEEEAVARRFFGRRSLLLNTPAAIRHVLIDRHASYGRTRATERILRPILGDGLFLAEGDAWRHQRRTMAPSFAPRPVAALAGCMAAAAEEAFAPLRPRESGTDLMALFQVLTLEIAGRTMFSLEMRRHAPALRGFITEYGARLGRPYLLDILLPRGLPTPQDLGRWRFRRRWMAFIEQLMDERAAAGPSDGPRDLFALLACARDPETGAAFTREQLRDQVATLIVAGHETTALALFWSACLLALAPATQDAVAGEAAAADLSPDEAEDGLARLPLTRAVVEEALRLYPPAFTIVREAKVEDRIGDLAIRAGSLVMISPWVLHRHRRLWDAPDAFDPRRFLPGAKPVERFAYLPFGVGPRICIGAQFALTEATLVLARLVRDWRITLAGSRPVLPVAVVTTQPDHAPLFRLERRAGLLLPRCRAAVDRHDHAGHAARAAGDADPVLRPASG